MRILLTRTLLLLAVLAAPDVALAQIDAFTNAGQVTVSTGYDASATTIVLTTGHGARLPSSGSFNLAWWDSTTYPSAITDPNYELVRCTRSTDTLTCTRAQEGTSASTKNTAGKTYAMLATITAKTLTDINTALGATFLTTSTNSVLTNEAVLTGTANQVILTGSTLSLPQSIATSSTPTFGGMTLNGAFSVTSTGTPGVNYVGDGGASSVYHDTYATSTQSIYRYRRARGTLAAPLRAKSGDTLGNVQFWGAAAASDVAAAAFNAQSAVIRAVALEDITTTAGGAKIEFLTAATGSASSATRATIDATGLTLASGVAVIGSSGLTLTASGVLAATSTGNTTVTSSGTMTLASSGTTAINSDTAVYLSPKLATAPRAYYSFETSNVPSGGADQNQAIFGMVSQADSSAGYFNPVVRWGAKDTTGSVNGYELGMEGNMVSGAFSGTKRLYLWDFTGNRTLFKHDAIGASSDTFEFGEYHTQWGLRVAIYGQQISTDADLEIASFSTDSYFTKNDSNTRTFYDTMIRPTLNFGGSNANTTLNVLNVDTINTSTTGATVNPLRLAYGGAELARFTSGGVWKIGGTANRSTTQETNAMALFNGTAPVGTLTNGVTHYAAGGRPMVMDAAGAAQALTILTNTSTADQTGFATDTYLTGSSLAIGGRVKAGTVYEWSFSGTKTAAGTSAVTYNVRVGTAGTTADTARVTFSPATLQTAAADSAVWTVRCVVRSVSATGTIACSLHMGHNLQATGFASIANVAGSVVSGTYDNTGSTDIVGLSVNGGTSASWTIHTVTARATNLAQ